MPLHSGHSKAFRKVLETKQPSCSEPHQILGATTPKMVVALYHPMVDKNQALEGVVRTYIPIKEVFPDELGQGRFVLIDQRGEVLLGSIPHSSSLSPTPIPYQSAFAETFDGWNPNEKTGICTERATGERFYYARDSLDRIPGGGKLIYLYPASLATANLSLLRRVGLFAAGASVVLLLLFALGAGAWIARPVRAAANAAADVADGDLYTVLSTDQGPHELRMLSLTLNSMTAEVRRRRDDLEDLVAQRTRSLQEMSAFLHAIMDGFQDALVVVEAESGSLRFINQEAYRLFEFLPDENSDCATLPTAEDVSRKLADWMGSDTNWSDFRNSAKTSQSPLAGRFAVAHETVESIEIGTAPVHDPQGEILGTLWVFRDVSEHERDEAKERQRQKLEAVGRLAGGIAHDFNNILTAIQGGIELAMLDQEDGNNPLPALTTSRTGCRRAAGVVHQLLSFSRQRPLELKHIDLVEIVEETIALVSPGIDPRIRIQTRLESDGVPMVEVDPGQIQQVLMNLVINASHAMEAGSITVRCAVEPGTSDTFPTGSCVLQVIDTGHGMTPEIMAHIFDPYFTTKAPGEGTGLGLATSIGIVERHQGTMNCESTEGVGTTFTVRLPYREGSVSIVPDQAPIPIGRALSARILIIDDEDPIRKIGRRLLERAYHTIEEAETGLEGLEKIEARNGEYDLVILDLTMPRLSGAETLQRIRASWSTLPVLVWSGHSEDAIRMLSDTDAPDGYINKPFNAEVLQCKVTEILRTNQTAKSKPQLATKA